MTNLKKAGAFLLTILLGLTTFSCSDEDTATTLEMTPQQTLESTPWETTNAKNNNGESIALDNVNVSNFVGYAYFKSNGKFTMYNLDNSPKMQGDWSISADGKQRTIIAKNPETGATMFTRVVDITVLTSKEFTYRIYPNADDRQVYFDIIHTPTKHPEPKQ